MLRYFKTLHYIDFRVSVSVENQKEVETPNPITESFGESQHAHQHLGLKVALRKFGFGWFTGFLWFSLLVQGQPHSNWQLHLWGLGFTYRALGCRYFGGYLQFTCSSLQLLGFLDLRACWPSG